MCKSRVILSNVHWVFIFLCACVSECGFFSGFSSKGIGHMGPKVSVGTHTHRRMRECWIKGKTSLRTFKTSMNLKFIWACMCMWLCASRVRLCLNSAIEPIDGLWPAAGQILYRTEKNLSLQLALFFIKCRFLLCVRVSVCVRLLTVRL